MNFFLAIPINNLFLQNCFNLVEQIYPLLKTNPTLHWTHFGNSHLSIHFFGSVDYSQLKTFIIDLHLYLEEIKEFPITIKSIYNFPKENSDLLAAYVNQNLPLSNLYQVVQKAVADHQLVPETRPYLPHITLCRSRQHGSLKLEPILVDQSVFVRELTLFQTQSTPEGSIYKPLKRWVFSISTDDDC